MAVFTHRGLRLRGRRDYGKQSQAHSIPPSLKVYFDCTDPSPSATGYISDFVSGYRLLADAQTTTLDIKDGSEPGNNVTVGAIPVGLNLRDNTGSPSTLDIGDKDFLVANIANAEPDELGASNHPGYDFGTYAMYVTDPGNYSFRMHPHYAVWLDEETGLRVPTPFYSPLKYRNQNQKYVTAAGRRGSEIVHFCEEDQDGGKVVESVSAEVYSRLSPAAKAIWDSMSFRIFFAGHTVYGDGTTEVSGNTEGEFDCYGIYLFVFENGMPDDVPAFLDRLKAARLSGDLAIPPDWVSVP